MSEQRRSGRLSTLAAAYVVARRDFVAILFSRSFIFFLLGPLFPIVVGGLAGGIGQSVKEQADRPELGIAMSAEDVAAMRSAHQRIAGQIGLSMPVLVTVKELAPGEAFDPAAAMRANRANLAAIVTGTPAAPVLTGPDERIRDWQGRVALLAAEARASSPAAYPEVTLAGIATSKADQTHSRLVTAQLGQTVLFLLTMLLAGMVLSNLVEEKGNKIIEVLAAAIPMDAVFLGKLFAMLAVSWVGITVWGLTGSAVWLAAGGSLQDYPAPALGWPTFLALGVVYFSLGYLLLGSIFLAIGSMASTVREVQTLSMPVTMLQLLNFFFASYALSRSGTAVELAAIAVPFSSPFAMLARAAQDGAVWPHVAAIGWQLLWVAVLVRGGAALFRKRVMKSGPAGTVKRSLWQRLRSA
ncbi:MAG TPA: ABC transporter permease [Novosphingobium sp.]|nr:ABC transporter permease [Novosphingobium sp.]HQN54109.1 ABC transporter permease [Novosphingobium sp.]